MPPLDRLSSLMARFDLRVRPVVSDDADMFIYAGIGGGDPRRLVLSRRGGQFLRKCDGEVAVFRAVVEWGGDTNPLLRALPDVLELRLEDNKEIAAIISLLITENTNPRCGSATVLSKLCEILIIRLMRTHLECGKIEAGVFAGLADPRLSRAIVAMHDNPGKRWTNDDLAAVAGLSLSRFAELFARLVGEPPFTYLRRWRLVLARQDIAQGARIQDTASKYGYRSGEALCRAFKKQFGKAPTQFRPHGTNWSTLRSDGNGANQNDRDTL